ncbi:MAG: hypothetical protein MI862_00445 [Desulfobacterales bacterium]|nr:hypothetical protein [Desulfobacterales bacterium]
MTIPKTAKKGLGSIRTHTDRAYRGIPVHKAYLKIGSIEMEKDRRMNERKALQTRIEEIDTRCRELDEEKRRLLFLSGERKNGLKKGRGGRRSLPVHSPGSFAGHPADRPSAASSLKKKNDGEKKRLKTVEAAEQEIPARPPVPERKKRQAVSGSSGKFSFTY